jgi:nicotinamide phosphoribosyltransferase
MNAGFACSNVALGVGSFSFQCIEEDGMLKPFTRDTFSSCIKATYCEINGKPTPIFKNPKEGGFKTSQKGCCVVFNFAGEDGRIEYVDGRTWDEAVSDEAQLLRTVFVDGKMVKEQSLAEIRDLLHGGDF